MRMIAITGSIGCGKTTIAKMIRQQGYVVFDVDAWVRRLYFNKKFIEKVRETFPAVAEGEGVNKRKLRNIVFSDRNQLKILEKMTHPFLLKYFKQVIHRNSRVNKLFFVDVALLFEMGWDRFCDKIIVADVDYEIQKQRVMIRDKVEAEDFEKINKVQMSNEKKKELADVVIDTDKPKNVLNLEVITLLQELENL